MISYLCVPIWYVLLVKGMLQGILQKVEIEDLLDFAVVREEYDREEIRRMMVTDTKGRYLAYNRRVKKVC